MNDGAGMGKALLDAINDGLLAIGIALVGGLARVMMSKEPMTFKSTAQGLIISGFCGIIVTLITGEYSLTHLMRGATIGMSGYVGPALLPYVTEQCKRVVSKFIGNVTPPSGGDNGTDTRN